MDAYQCVPIPSGGARAAVAHGLREGDAGGDGVPRGRDASRGTSSPGKSPWWWSIGSLGVLSRNSGRSHPGRDDPQRDAGEEIDAAYGGSQRRHPCHRHRSH